MNTTTPKTAAGQGSPLQIGGTPLTRIAHAPEAPRPVRFAAAELAAYLKKALGTELPAGEGEPAAGTIFLATRDQIAGRPHPWSRTDHDRAVIFADGGGLFLVGEHPRAVVYAAYDFLQAFLGIRFFGPGEEHEYVPARAALDLPAGLALETGSAIELRDYFARTVEAADFAIKNRINCFVTPGEQEEYGPVHDAIHERGGVMRGPGHIWRRFLPDHELFEKQPELFPLIEGERKITEQGACFSNPQARQIFFDKWRAYIREHNFWDIFALWAEDAYYPHYCGCEQCATKTTGEWYMTMVNGLAQVVDEEFPGRLFEFAAYHETRWPTQGVDQLYKNGQNMLADLSLGYTRDLFSPLAGRHGGNDEVMRMYEAWRAYLKKLGYQGRILMVDYYNWCEAPNMSRAGRCLLWPMEVIREDTRFYRAEGIQALSDWICFARLCWPTPFNLWAWFQIYRDPERTVESLKDDFYPAYFGLAAAPMRATMDKLYALMSAPATAENMNELRGLSAALDAAQAGTDPVLHHRIEVVRTHLDFAILHQQIWMAFEAGDEAAWLALEQPYRDFFEKTHRDVLEGEVDIKAYWQQLWYDFYVKQGRPAIERLLTNVERGMIITDTPV